MIQLIKLMQPVVGDRSVPLIGMKNSSREGGVDLVKEFKKKQTDAVSVGQEPITAGMGQLFNEAFGSQLPQFVTDSAERAFLDWYCQGLRYRRV